MRHEFRHDLPEGTIEWIESTIGGEITHLHRHVARREAWVVDVERGDGSVVEIFLRLQRDAGMDPRRLEKETRITEVLDRNGVPVSEVLGWNEALQVTLFARDSGRADIDHLESPRQQRAIMEDFMRAIGRVHLLDLDSLGLDALLGPRPETPQAAALDSVDEITTQWKFFLDKYRHPLPAYCIDWLHRFAPTEVPRVSLVQGDTGPVNFMFESDRVSSIVDWETGHWGDPQEDLGNIMVREFFNPCGGLKGLFELWSKETGLPYDRFRARYYAVHQNTRGMVPIHFTTLNAHPREAISGYLCFRYVSDRATCQMLAQAMDIEIEPPEMPDGEGESDILAEAAAHALRDDVTPAVEDPFARSRVEAVEILIACMDRKRRFGAALEAIECDEIGALLGSRPASLPEGHAALQAAITAHELPDEKVLPYLARQAFRDEWLWAPAVALYPDREWAEID